MVRFGLDAVPPVSAPGEGFTYSNTNYFVLGMLVEELTGQPVHEVVTERVIEPLGLAHTVFPAPGARALPAPSVTGYQGVRVGVVGVWTPVTAYDPSLYSSAGGMISTMEDLAAFHRAVAAGQLLSTESRTAMRTLRQVETGMGYGLGVTAFDLSCGGTAWGHNAQVPGYTTFTLVTDDGRFASAVTNWMVQFGQRPTPQQLKVLDTALCEDAPQRD